MKIYQISKISLAICKQIDIVLKLGIFLTLFTTRIFIGFSSRAMINGNIENETCGSHLNCVSVLGDLEHRLAGGNRTTCNICEPGWKLEMGHPLLG